MVGAEWLNIQDIFALFLGPWIVFYLGAAVAGTFFRSVLSVWWNKPRRMKITSMEEQQ